MLQALVWVLQDDVRARRLLDLTGLDPADLRARVEEPATLRAIGEFLEAHEPDLIACAAALGVAPTALLAAKDAL